MQITNKAGFSRMKNIVKYIMVILVVIFAISLIVYSKRVSQAIIDSTKACLTVVVPSLFAFMVVSNLIVKSNIYILLSKPFYPVARYILRIPPELFSIFLLSNIGGYPIGAKLLTELLSQNKISKNDAETMMCYCYCNSPSFFAGAVGVIVFENVMVGLICYFSIVISNFLIAAIIGLKNKIPVKTKTKVQIKLNAEILIDSINSAAKTLFTICVMLIFFASIISVLFSSDFVNSIIIQLSQYTNDDKNIAETFIRTFIEISNVSKMTKYSYMYVPILTGLAAFGGLCVLTQIISITKNKISLKKFYISRGIHIAFSGIICYYLIKIFAKEIVIATMLSPKIINSSSVSVVPSICLIIMTILLINKENDSQGKVCRNENQ